MTKSKVNQEIKNRLFSANTAEVIAAINLLKEKGNKDYLPILFELLVNNPEDEIKKATLALFGTIKDKETIPLFAGALQEDKFRSIRKEILTTCWQNGLDFSSYLELLIDIIVLEEWEVAFEAFTLIENMDHFPPEEEMHQIKLKIASILKTSDSQKAYFLEEIIKLAP